VQPTFRTDYYNIKKGNAGTVPVNLT